jgi:hypothetical protein
MLSEIAKIGPPLRTTRHLVALPALLHSRSAAGDGFPTFAVAVIAGRRREAVAGSALEYTALVGQHDGLRAVPHVQFLQ